MSNLQRGVYQPLADKVPIYDLADEDPEEERSRAPLLVVIALVVLAGFAAVVWLAYNQGVERGRQGASLVITAPEGPVRIAPPETESKPPLTVYDTPIPPDQEAKRSSLAPQPAVEAPPIRLTPQAAPAPPPAGQATKAQQPPQTAKAPPPPQTAKASQPPPQVATAQQPPPQTAKAQQAPQPPQPAAAPPPAAAARSPGAAATASAAATKALSGAAVLQIGAFESVELANGAWAAFRSRHQSVAGLSPDVQRADLGAKGVFYRLRVGPFPDREAAADACVQLRAEGATCFVSAP